MSNTNIKVGLFTSVYFNNIGNAFIDMGAEEQLKVALPEGAQLIKLSMGANFSASLGRLFDIKYNPIVRWIWHNSQKFINNHHDATYATVSTLDVLSPVKIAKLDYLVIPGCVLTLSFFKIYGRLLENKVAQGCKLIFWAASGNFYGETEVEYVKNYLLKLKPFAISFRDSVAYNHFKEYSENVYNGIDNVFFINRIDLPKCDTTLGSYTVLNFDSKYNECYKIQVEKKLKGRKIIYTDHQPYPYRKIGQLAKKGVVCSDYPLDYLFLYKNTEETHTDRVHACIPTLAFGNKAQLYADSPRIALFENVGISLDDLKAKPTSIDLEKLKQLQDNQIIFLKKLFVV